MAALQKRIKTLSSCLAALCTMLVNKTPRLKPFNGLGLTQFLSPSKTINQLVCERMCRLKNSSPQAALFCYLQKVGLDLLYIQSFYIKPGLLWLKIATISPNLGSWPKLQLAMLEGSTGSMELESHQKIIKPAIAGGQNYDTRHNTEFIMSSVTEDQITQSIALFLFVFL